MARKFCLWVPNHGFKSTLSADGNREFHHSKAAVRAASFQIASSLPVTETADRIPVRKHSKKGTGSPTPSALSPRYTSLFKEPVIEPRDLCPTLVLRALSLCQATATGKMIPIKVSNGINDAVCF